MRIDLRDEFHNRIGRIDVDPSLRPTRVSIVDSDREVFLDWDTAIDDAGNLRRCVACGCDDLYRTKAFQQFTWLVVVLAFALATVSVLGLATTPAVFAAMIVVLIADVATFVFARQRLVCYRCRSTFRGIPIARYHRGWDRTIAERYPTPKSQVAAPDTSTEQPESGDSSIGVHAPKTKLRIVERVL